jgi:oligopeptide transport system substrate-binding protein
MRATFRSLTLATLSLSVATLLMLGLGGCTKTSNDPANTVRFAMSSEPPNLNSMKATDQASFFVLGHVMEGLTRTGQDGSTQPGVAEKWEINDQGATFFLRKNAKWSDGKPVTAKDFAFAWRTALDPKTASEYAFILYPIKNAEKLNKGEVGPAELGVTVVDETTLKVTFEKPCGYFLALTSFSTYFPVREDFFMEKKDKYAAEAGDMLYNGAFKLTSWVHGASLTLDKNAEYWNSQAIKLDRVSVPYITSDNIARFNFFKEKKTDLLEGLSKDDLPRAQTENFRLKNHTDGSVWFMEFNFREGKPTRNKNLRKAIQLIFDAQEYTSKVVGIPGTKPGTTLIPSWVRGEKDNFRREFPYSAPARNLEEAKKLIEVAKKELGGSIPSLVWLTGDTPASAREAEYFQSQFKEHLGLDLKIDKQIFKQRLAKMSSGDFDIVSAGWGPDYADPMTFADLMSSWNENNRGKWSNAQYDALIRKAQATSDQSVRMKAMAEAEKLALDELAILPTYERAVIWTHHERIQGVHRGIIGMDPDFTYSSITEGK